MEFFLSSRSDPHQLFFSCLFALGSAGSRLVYGGGEGGWGAGELGRSIRCWTASLGRPGIILIKNKRIQLQM